MHRRHAEMLSHAAVGADDLQAVGVTLRRLERFWIRAADLVQRPQPSFPSVKNAVPCRGTEGSDPASSSSA
jgi:hypothetical protein